MCDSQWLLPSEGGYVEAEGIERTSNFRQENIVREVDLLSSRKAFDLKLPGKCHQCMVSIRRLILFNRF